MALLVLVFSFTNRLSKLLSRFSQKSNGFLGFSHNNFSATVSFAATAFPQSTYAISRGVRQACSMPHRRRICVPAGGAFTAPRGDEGAKCAEWAGIFSPAKPDTAVKRPSFARLWTKPFSTSEPCSPAFGQEGQIGQVDPTVMVEVVPAWGIGSKPVVHP